jgi:hypothetical protein
MCCASSPIRMDGSCEWWSILTGRASPTPGWRLWRRPSKAHHGVRSRRGHYTLVRLFSAHLKRRLAGGRAAAVLGRRTPDGERARIATPSGRTTSPANRRPPAWLHGLGSTSPVRAPLLRPESYYHHVVAGTIQLPRAVKRTTFVPALDCGGDTSTSRNMDTLGLPAPHTAIDSVS